MGRTTEGAPVWLRTLCVGMGVLACLTFGRSARGENAATRIIQKGETTLRGVTTQAVLEMTIVRPTFTRQLKLRTWTRGRQDALVEILDPPKETGVASLRTGNQMWNYLPKADQVVRVPPSMMLQSWMGSDFTNDDLVKASSLVRDYRHRILKYSGRGKARKVLIELRPRPRAPVVWGRILHWARVSDSLPVKQEYFDEQGKPVRTLWFSRFQRMDDRIIPTRITVKKADAPRELTTVRYDRILYDRVVPDRFFNRHRLKQITEEGKNLARGWNHRRLPKARRTLMAWQ